MVWSSCIASAVESGLKPMYNVLEELPGSRLHRPYNRPLEPKLGPWRFNLLRWLSLSTVVPKLVRSDKHSNQIAMSTAHFYAWPLACVNGNPHHHLAKRYTEYAHSLA